MDKFKIRQLFTFATDKQSIISENIPNIYMKCTFHHDALPKLILHPRLERELIKYLAIIKQHSLTFYVISCGQNWGYGSKTAPCNVDVIIDLQYMNNIIKINAKEKYARIEPGVSFLQLVEYLKINHPDLLVDLTAGPVSGSIIGNALTHGHGVGILGNHAKNIFNINAVLVNGEKLRTGSNRFLDAFKINHLSGQFAGPDYNGLFIQNNYAIITKASIKLFKKPKSIFIFKVPCYNQVETTLALNKIRQLREQKIINTIPIFNNAIRELTSYYHQSQLHSISSKEITELCKKHNIGEWNLNFAIMGEQNYSNLMLNYYTKVFNELSLSSSIVTQTKNESGYAQNLISLLSNDINYELNWSKYLSYDEHYFSPYNDPNLDNCGVVFITTITPIEIKSVTTVTNLITQYCEPHNIIPIIQIFHFEGMVLNIYIRLCFNRNTHELIINPLVIHIQEKLLKLGYYFCRLSHIEKDLDKKLDNSLYTLIKNTFDPSNLYFNINYAM